jgi:hypothetical protein
MITKTPSPAELALRWIKRGCCPIPVPHKQKGPKLPGWQQLHVTADNCAAYFNSEPTNIGLLLGEASGGVVDVDLDHRAAVALADVYLPATATFGRASNPDSHRLYKCLGVQTKKYSHKTMLVELRSDGCQTLVPGSTHPSGEVIQGRAAPTIKSIDPAKLLNLVGRVAAGALLAREWEDHNGLRHELTLSLTGALLHAGWAVEEAAKFIGAICVAADDEERCDRIRAVEDTAKRYTAGEAVTGWPRLTEHLGDAVVRKLREWLQVSDAPRLKVGPTTDKPTEDVDNALCVVGIRQFLEMKIPKREDVLAPWLPRQGLGMVHGPRGVGKTQVSLNIAYAVASAGEFLRWKADVPRGVLFIDGEMPSIMLQERLAAIALGIGRDATAPLNIITPDLNLTTGIPDLATLEGQQLIDKHITPDIVLIIIDNLSTLVRSGRENESESWQPMQAWALQLRARGKSVLFVHHSGRSGQQRGTSKREDVLDTIISLRVPAGYEPSQGACFDIHFEKARGLIGEAVKTFQAQLTVGSDHKQVWTCKDLMAASLEQTVRLYNEGRSQKAIAEELGLSEGRISQLVSEGRIRGLVTAAEEV